MCRGWKPVVRHALLLTDAADASAAHTIPLGSPEWFAWLTDHAAFIFEGTGGRLSARREARRGIAYWYGYRRRDGKLAKTYLGKPQELTQDRLEQASALLAGPTPLSRMLRRRDSTDLIAALDSQTSLGRGARTAGETSFLSLSKVKPPALPQQLVTRRRLTRRINTPVTLICAPSGFGKSTLLNEWRQTCQAPVAWVSLDADDNSPLKFWSVILSALQTVNPNIGRELIPLLYASPARAQSEIVARFTDEIVRAQSPITNPATEFVTDPAEQLPRIGLILDDYHHIQDPDIHAGVQLWIERLPPGMQLLIASRTRPPLAMGLLRAKGVIAEIETEDLRFTPEEGIDLLSRHTTVLQLAHGDMQAIVKRTEGWAAGLILVTLALNRHDDASPLVASLTGAHTYFREYFREAVLYRQPPSAQAFLLRTSILRHLHGALCDAVTGRADGDEMLSRLWQDNLFLVRMEEPGWYRYHDLFAEMLCSQLESQHPAELGDLHRRAAEWYRKQNAPADAVYHLLAVEAWEEAAALIESVALRELEQLGEDSRLLRWLQQLPEDVVQKHKTLVGVYVRLARMALVPTELERLLAHAETSIARVPVVEQTATAQGALTEIQRIRRLWTTSDLQLSELPSGGEHDDVWRMLNDLAQSQCCSRERVDEAEAQVHAVYETARARRHLFVIVMAGGQCALYALSQGHLRRSERLALEVLDQALALRGKLPEPASIALVALSGVCYERNQLEAAHQFLVRAKEVDPNPTSPSIPVMVAVQRAQIQMAQGDVDAAFASIQTARKLHARRPTRMWLDQDFDAYQALISLRQGDPIRAERLLCRAGNTRDHILTAFVRAEILLKQNRAAIAEELLSRVIARYPHGSYRMPIVRGWVMLALALYAQHQVNPACRRMADGLRFAAPESLMRAFLDHGPASVPVLSLTLQTEKLGADTRAFVVQVLHTLGHDPQARPPDRESELGMLSAAAAISERERQVLQLVSAGLSNHEIAARFAVSDCTVKTHLQNIYRKLGVNSRTQAIARAQALRLVPVAPEWESVQPRDG